MFKNLLKSKKEDKPTIPNLEERVDKILIENEDKLRKLGYYGINQESFCLKDKKNSKLFYLRKKTNNSEVLSKKIIKKAKINLGEKELEKSEELDEVVNEIEHNIKKESNNKKIEDKKKKEQDFISVTTDNLAELKRKYSDKIEVSELENETEEDKNIGKEKIEPKKELKNTNFKDNKNIEEGLKGASKPKKSFFSKDKPLEKTKLESKEEQVADEKSIKKQIFRVDNLPKREDFEEDERKLLDEKIKGSSNNIENKSEKNIAEIKALNLAEAHLKEKSFQIEKQEQDVKKEKKMDILFPTGVPLTKEENENEHVFFDEEDHTSTGWSPQAFVKGKKDINLPLKARGEIDSGKLQKVGDIELPKEVLQTKSVKLSDLGFSENEWEELDFYSLHEPFAYVEILREKESLDKCYFLVEIALTPEEDKLLNFIKDTMSSLEIDTEELDKDGEDKYLLDSLDLVINEYDIKIDEDSRKKIYYYIGKTSLGLGKIDSLMKDPNIEDISCDGAGVPLFLYHRKFGSLKSNVRYDDEDELSSFVHKLAQKCGKHISIAEPMLDATMPDGSRIQMTLSDEITAKGSTFTIRKFRDDPFSPPDLVEFNTMSSEMVAYMWLVVENGINTLFAGGTASGKTTALNALSLFIPRESKIVSIEETREINLPHPNWIPGVARSGFGEVVANRVIGEIDMYDLMKAALRQRPEYIIVGEIRGREAYVLFQAMATGHATYSTAHADSAQSLIHRLEGKPINIPRVMLQSLDIVCLHVTTRVKNIRARRCKQIIEIIDIDPTTKEILTNEVFRWDPVEDQFVYSGKSYILERIRAEKDMSREQMTQEIKNRMKIIEWMNKNNVREFRDVANLISQYCEAPVDTLDKIEKDEKI